jgi:hypothetical protein
VVGRGLAVTRDERVEQHQPVDRGALERAERREARVAVGDQHDV